MGFFVFLCICWSCVFKNCIERVRSLSELFRSALEKRRQELINKLIAFDIYKVQHKHLYELTLTQLENAYKSVIARSHAKHVTEANSDHARQAPEA